MTWRQLKEILSQMTENHLDDNVTIFVTNEFFPVLKMAQVNSDDDQDAGGVLDIGHSYLVVTA